MVTVLHGRIADWTRHTHAPMALLLLQVPMGIACPHGAAFFSRADPCAGTAAAASTANPRCASSSHPLALHTSHMIVPSPHYCAHFSRHLNPLRSDQPCMMGPSLKSSPARTLWLSSSQLCSTSRAPGQLREASAASAAAFGVAFIRST